MLSEIKRLAVLTFLVGAGSIGLPAPARAAISIVVQSRSVAPGTAGFLDVFVSGTDTGQVAASEVAVDLITGPPGFAFTGPAVLTSTGPSPRVMLLGNDGFESPNGADVNTAAHVSATQFPATPGELSTADGRGLMRVPFSVAADAAAGTTFGITLDTTITNLFLNDADFTPIVYTPVNGFVTVTPEPVCVLAGGVAIGLLLRRRRRG